MKTVFFPISCLTNETRPVNRCCPRPRPEIRTAWPTSSRWTYRSSTSARTRSREASANKDTFILCGVRPLAFSFENFQHDTVKRRQELRLFQFPRCGFQARFGQSHAGFGHGAVGATNRMFQVVKLRLSQSDLGGEPAHFGFRAVVIVGRGGAPLAERVDPLVVALRPVQLRLQRFDVPLRRGDSVRIDAGQYLLPLRPRQHRFLFGHGQVRALSEVA